MQFEVLGPIRLRDNGEEVPVSGLLRQTVLAVLLARANQPVAVDTLLGALWGEQPEPRGHQKLQLHIYKLRRMLDRPERLSYSSAGYCLEVMPGELDSERFCTLIDEAGDVADQDPARCAELTRKALSLWRGTPYQGLDVTDLAAEIERLADVRLVALEELYAAELRCGRNAGIVGELSDLVRRHPLRERFHALLMTALYQGGRPADALAAYHGARHVLVEELGLEPGAELRQIEQQILTGESIRPGTTGSPTTERPAQLPHSPGTFVGRAAELAELDRIAAGEFDEPARIVTITGTAGVGKTTLAVRWAHQMSERFPDGQLYIDLRGYGPDEPMAPNDALARFLRDLGVEGTSVPQDLTERAARFRTLADQRRILIVLDNAVTADQVRPLLPGTPTCFVLVTSRDSLAGLTVREGARRLDLDRMTGDDASRLLNELLDERRNADPEATAQLVERCARLPLALRIAAERIGERRGVGVADLIAELDDEQAQLDLFDAGDAHTSVRSVFSWSYRELSPESARLFRMFGLHPGYDLDAHALTALMGTEDLRATRRLLDELVRARLVDETREGRYQPHDLLLAYAAELAGEVDDEESRQTAITRLFDYYLQVAWTAVDVIAPQHVEMRPAVTKHPVTGPVLSTYQAALQWLETERQNLLSAADRATEYGISTYAIDMSAVLWRFLDVGWHVDDAHRLHTRALVAAREHADRVGEALALRALGLANHRMDRYETAAGHLRQALALQEELGDPQLLATTLNYLGATCHYIGATTEAIQHLERSIDLYGKLGNQFLQTKPLTNLGRIHHRLGRYEEAFQSLERAVEIDEQFGSSPSQAYILLNLAGLHRDAGNYDDALRYAQRVLNLARASEIHGLEGQALEHLGAVHRLLGDYETAEHHHHEALASARDNESRAQALNGLGLAHAARGASAEAIRYHHDALAVASDFGLRYELARSHNGLGDAHSTLGETEKALQHWQAALDIYQELHALESRVVREKLNLSRDH
ncbi:AfsR/SARP family transcriptional regulator [Phytoactinopolyspora mesophila]|uniref:Tetratricopeptide repeat protein n=1 Tax=Phytoactinopolyspora mesophila TaxID=2650750 RepID=A0A7K3M4I9_9ACTN|nr:tetratricopeptide repeat protein [Phytoactinopolyspora mesophila]NDL58165.1 tetratricopeptide repeat protein [Phytoactinopolyspora mesophila]